MNLTNLSKDQLNELHFSLWKQAREISESITKVETEILFRKFGEPALAYVPKTTNQATDKATAKALELLANFQ